MNSRWGIVKRKKIDGGQAGMLEIDFLQQQTTPRNKNAPAGIGRRAPPEQTGFLG